MSSAPTTHARDAGSQARALTEPQVELPGNPEIDMLDKKDEQWHEESSSVTPIDPKVLAKVIRRVDIIVLPVLTMLLAWCFIDRANMGLAAVAGMNVELGLVGFQYSTTLLVFFPGYVLFAIPSNFILNKTSVRYWLTFLSIAFGLFTMAMGFVQSFGALVAMRVFLGIFEAGVFPAIIVVVSSWYPRHYLGKRMVVVFCGASVVSSLAGVMAYGFSRIKAGGYVGWRWIFILEGIITVVFTAGAFFIIDEYPSKSRFLTAEQRDITVKLIAQDRGEHEEEKMTLAATLDALKDWKLWVFSTMYMFCTVTTYSFAYFVPLILNAQMGFSGALSQILTTPPYFWAFILAMTLGHYSDRYKMRSPFLIFYSMNVILGLALTRWGPNTGAQYLGLFFTLGGAQGNAATVISFAQNNAPTRVKRGVSSGLQLTFGAIGGIIGSTVFRSQDAPSYTPGIIVVLCGAATIAVLASLMGLYLARQNKQHRESGKILEGQQDFEYTP